MKILIYGAGIVGCTYGWQLSEAGHDITVLVRNGKKQSVEQSGIHIQCNDFRGEEKKVIDTIFCPKVIEELSSQNDFEYIIVSTNSVQLKEVLPILSKSAGRAHILFFQNNWDDFENIAKYLSPEQYFFGFPFMVGGGRDNKCIYSVISGLKYSNTPLGEANGEITPRVERMVKALEEANLKPVISKQILAWLITHFAVAAGLSAGVINAGGDMKVFTRDSEIMKDTIKSIREGFNVCKKRGINSKSEKANRLYHLPLFISVPIAKKVYSNELLCLMFEGHVKHSPDEMRKMLEDIINSGERYNVSMPYLRKLKNGFNI
jgi:Ketopantoate reductase